MDAQNIPPQLAAPPLGLTDDQAGQINLPPVIDQLRITRVANGWTVAEKSQPYGTGQVLGQVLAIVETPLRLARLILQWANAAEGSE